MAATIIRLPVVMKRGRKVRTGPVAAIVRLYEAISPEAAPAVTETLAERERELFDRIRVRSIERRAQALAWIQLSANVTPWPENRRYRSERLVRSLREGGEDVEEELPEDLEDARQEFLLQVQARAREIVSQEPSTTVAKKMQD